MTDITKLAQSWKTAAHKAKQANDLYLESKITLSECVVETKDYLDYSDNPNNLLALVEALEKAQRQNKSDFEIKVRLCKESNSLHDRLRAAEERIAELEREQETLRPVGVMSEKAFHRLESSESRFIALWPRPGIYLPRKRPEDGVIVYARTAAAAGIKVEAE